jgi:hypothetical protein
MTRLGLLDRWTRQGVRVAPADLSHAGAGETAAEVRDRPWRSIFKQAFVLWLATRAIFVLVTYFAQLVTVARPGAPGVPLPLGSFGAWQQYDAVWYLLIASSGYAVLPRAAFFPLYPLLVGLVHTLFGGNLLLLSGMLVSNAAALAAFYGIGLLAAGEDGLGASATAIRVFGAYPLALFTFAAYADGLFVACAAFALFFARRGAWLAAAGCAFLAALTRPMGIILIAPLVWEYGRRQRWWRAGWRPQVAPRRLAALAAVVLAVPLALAGYAIYLKWRFGDALAFVHVQALVWHRGTEAPWQTLALAWHAFFSAPFWSGWDARLWVDALPVAVILVLTVVGARELPVSFTLYMAGLLVVSLVLPKADNGIPLAAAGRYLLPAVPIFLLLGRWIRRWSSLDTLIIGGGFALQAIFTAYFLTGGYLI